MSKDITAEEIKKELDSLRSNIKELNEIESNYQETADKLLQEREEYKTKLKTINDSYYKLVKYKNGKLLNTCKNFNEIINFPSKNKKKS